MDDRGSVGRIAADRWSGERRLLIELTILALFLLAWIAPPLAIGLAWPFLFVVPGWLLVSRVVPGLSAPGRLGLAVVTSIYASAHLTNLVSTIHGSFDRASVFVVVALLALGSAALLLIRAPGISAPPSLSIRAAASSMRADRSAWLIATGAALAVGGVLGASAWHHTSAGWISGGWNWSDFLVHVSIANSLLFGNFPPQVPYFSGMPLTYHWFADFHAAITASAADVDVIPIFVLTNALMAGVLALLVRELAGIATRRRRVASIAALLVIFGGGLGWIRLPMDLAKSGADLANLLATTPYDNVWADDWPFFRIASVFGTGLLPHRATALGLPGLVAVVVLVWHSLGRNRAGMLLAGLIAALLAPFQFYVFPATYLIVALLALGRRAWRSPGWAVDAALFLGPLVLALPFVVGPALLQEQRGAIRLVVGWSEARIGDGAPGVAFFYLTNLGLPFVLALAALLRRTTPHRAFFGLWLAALFMVPNVVILSAVAFDMNKYFQIMWIAAAILAAVAIANWPKPLIASVVVLAAISPALVGIWHVASQSVALTDDQQQAAVWIAQHTPPRAIFVADAFINSPVDLAGRLRITTFGPYVANLGYDPDQRAKDVAALRCDGAEAAAQVMARYGATYVLSSGGKLECTGTPTDLSATPLFEKVYEVGGVAIWHFLGGG